VVAARRNRARRQGWFGPCRCWVSAGKGPGNTRKTRLALGYALCGLLRSAEGFGAAVLDRRQGWFGQKGCAMAYTSVQKGTRGRRRSSPRFGLKGRPARSARRRRSAAEGGRHSRSERCRASPGSWLHGWTRNVSTKHKPGLDGADPHRRREIAMADCPHLRAAQHGTRKAARACGAALR